MKAMIAGIMVSVPLPSEAFCAWEKRASPTNSGRNDQDDSKHTNEAQPVAPNKPTRQTSTRALQPRLDSRSHHNVGTTEKGSPKSESHPPGDDAATETPVLRKGSTTSRPAEGTDTVTGGEREARARRRRSSSRSAAGPSASAPDLPVAVADVAGSSPTDVGPRLRESGRSGDDDDEEKELGKVRAGRRWVDDQATRGGGGGGARVLGSNNAARRAPAAAVVVVAGEAGGGRSAAAAAARRGAREGAADTGGPGAQAGSEVFSAPSRGRVKGELPPAGDHHVAHQDSLDVVVGVGYAAERASQATWGTGRRIEEDQAAAAAASAIAGVGWRNLRRDTVTALVRQLGRCVTQEQGQGWRQKRVGCIGAWKRLEATS